MVPGKGKYAWQEGPRLYVASAYSPARTTVQYEIAKTQILRSPATIACFLSSVVTN